ncbi:sigma-70-like protein [Kribbella amoyensis]|uniref:Sigma-70-like protein n=1 Tax=Kribbella amoyensis TaxID=996641 RepID=A0A561B0P8_9ACTN|nr:sigma factor-like helix-turn-helix DNA-binding protein [Kribbella amoyensis]TWD72435.1 sigma-70-like protein [Kribbella amoyensis]
MRDLVDPEFASFVDARQAKWLREAYLVYGERHRAERELLRAFARLATRWDKVDDPDVFVQRLLFQPALSRWHPPKRYPPSDDAVRSALAALSPAQRTVFVLLHYEELTEFEVADVLVLSHHTVHGLSRSALTAFRTSLGLGRWKAAGDRP